MTAEQAAKALVEAKRDVNNWFRNPIAADLILALIKADQRFQETQRADKATEHLP